MNRIDYPSRAQWADILKRPYQPDTAIEPVVRDVFRKIQEGGDEAVRHYTREYDRIDIGKPSVSEEDLKSSTGEISSELRDAIEQAYSNIERFHRAQRQPKVEMETSPGVSCWQEKRPIEKVGLYIPGGSAPLFSTVLMLAIPAQLAGCTEIILCSPPGADGNLHPAIRYAALRCGLKQVYRIGGIQAIAAMTFGTATIPAVYKIFGPGNQYVTLAKQMATSYGVAIDMPAGPSELLIAADDSADPSFIASDLLSQAEHGPDSQVLLVTTSESLPGRVETEVAKQLEALPRKEIAKMAMANSKLILMASDREATEFINEYGPEHYMICSSRESYYLEQLRNAGSVFLGNYTPESAGDYASGTNHTLPTNGYTKQYSGVNLDSFMKSITFQRITPNGLNGLGPAIEVMAEAEGLVGHKQAVSLRLRKLREEEIKTPYR